MEADQSELIPQEGTVEIAESNRRTIIGRIIRSKVSLVVAGVLTLIGSGGWLAGEYFKVDQMVDGISVPVPLKNYIKYKLFVEPDLQPNSSEPKKEHPPTRKWNGKWKEPVSPEAEESDESTPLPPLPTEDDAEPFYPQEGEEVRFA